MKTEEAVGMMDPRILNKVIEDEETGCWQWQGARTTCGYPVIARGSNTNIRGHRYVFEWVNGPLEDGQVVRHTCDNPLCVNPDHLESGTPDDNVQDRNGRGRTHGHVDQHEERAIRALREAGFTYQGIADRLGIKFKRVEWVLAEKLRRKRG